MSIVDEHNFNARMQLAEEKGRLIGAAKIALLWLKDADHDPVQLQRAREALVHALESVGENPWQ